MKYATRTTCLLALLVLSNAITGCGKNEVAQALDSDANGYICLKCKAKFYTGRTVIASYCPACKDPGVVTVTGFHCADDKHVTYAVRARGGVACEQCRKITTGVVIPREADLKTWGAEKKSAAEVGAQ